MNKLQEQVLVDLLRDVNGASFIAVSTKTIPEMNRTTSGKGSQANPHFGKISKIQTESSVLVFQNKRQHGYNNMVKRRLIAEGKDPDDFKLSPRTWGERIPNMPLVVHDGALYLEVIFLTPGPVSYELSGKPIPKNKIIGLRAPSVPYQGGVDRKVRLRVISFDSITHVKIDGVEMHIA